MKNAAFSPRTTNRKIHSVHVGTLTEVSEYLRLLYAKVAEIRNRRRTSGSCTACSGTETAREIDPGRMIAPELSLKRGAVLLWAGSDCGPVKMIRQLAKLIGIDYEKPLAEQDPRFIEILLYGYAVEPVSYVHNNKQKTGYYRGCVHDLRYMRDAGTKSKGNLRAIDYFSELVQCPACNGSKLNAESLRIQIQELIFEETARLSVPELLSFVRAVPSSVNEEERQACLSIVEELEARLNDLNRIGLRTLR